MYSAKTVFRSPLICEICEICGLLFCSVLGFNRIFRAACEKKLVADENSFVLRVFPPCSLVVSEKPAAFAADTLESKMFKIFLIFSGHGPSISAKRRVALH
jgi:hypothetical protein